MEVYPGYPFPLGATFDGAGTNFSIFSEVAEKVQLCLFDEKGEETQIDLPENTAYCWHGYLPSVNIGQRYGYRVHGPWNPKEGLRCCAPKLLMDPYAKAIEGSVKWDKALFAYNPNDLTGPPNDSNSAPYMPKCLVINPYYDWSKDSRPRISLHETIVYEVHVKGFTARHPDIPEELRGTYAGLAHPVSIEYLKKLGITSIELMPVHQFVHDSYLLDKGLKNYWGYNTISYFAPHNEYTVSTEAGRQVQEFKQMVAELHKVGIEVILDVVYNHTAEGNHMGPMLSFKGIDNTAYYRLVEGDKPHYMDYTGTGNTLNMRHPYVLQLVMDSLRYWITEMHVDGFRFDLAATLARTLHDVDRLSAFFDIIHQDPIISQAKLIAEPWDVGTGGYQVGNFPSLWSEWNGKYRDTVRDYWRGTDRTLPEFANRITGSSDLYEGTGRRPHASVNFVTAHDGFTLHDLVSYNQKHNEANGEEGRDGADDNRSWNCGAEGPTNDVEIIALRAKQKRNFLASLLLSQGIPMIEGGDEMGRTQQGNNNAYCQDNEITWFDWEHADQNLFDFVKSIIQLRKDHPVFRRWKWFNGAPTGGSNIKDIGWYKPDGGEMGIEDWHNGVAKSLQIFLCGDLNSLDSRGQPVVDNHFFLLFNAYWEPLMFTLPSREVQGKWTRLIDATEPVVPNGQQVYKSGDKVPVEARAMVVLCHVE